ncbi:hypothetical protein Acr_08g0006670 [Actinidia rufa]|uniref:Uncharacterized protein n=1 Tax=Actinidia rufa TaxID=165716 RepID=A0A7J0F0Q1_9ERIC|nr:hypothetical protein Acr_08g0006670 [Actinidia rufa]
MGSVVDVGFKDSEKRKKSKGCGQCDHLTELQTTLYSTEEGGCMAPHGVPSRVHYLDKLHQKTGRSYQFTSHHREDHTNLHHHQLRRLWERHLFHGLDPIWCLISPESGVRKKIATTTSSACSNGPSLSGDHQVTIDPLAAKNGEDNIGGERVENSVPLRRNLHQRGVGPNADEAQSHAVQSKAKTVVALEHTGETRPIWDEQMRQMQAQLAGVITAVKEKGTNSVEELITGQTHPSPQRSFRPPGNIQSFDGPPGCSDEIMCRAFLQLSRAQLGFGFTGSPWSNGHKAVQPTLAESRKAT